MTWAERLLRLTAGGAPPATDVARFHAMTVAGARSLARCAELAPQPSVADELRRLCEIETAAAGRLAEGFRAMGIPAPPAPTPPPAANGQSHWARLVQVLERQREIRKQLFEAAIEHAETHPELAVLLGQLSREKEALIEQLRDLIARADPQAID